jgi:hypothetical protein
MIRTENGKSSSTEERRAKKRFGIERPLRYRFLYGASIGQVANGRAVDASSSGVLLESANELKVGDPLELLIDWPAQLNGDVPLQLVTAGCVVRVQGKRCAVSVERYEFRTRSK